MHHSQQGFSLTEIAIACGVLATMVIGGLSFYNNQIAKAQASEAMTVGNLMSEKLKDAFLTQPILGNISLANLDDFEYIQSVSWTPQPASFHNTTNDWGWIDIHFKSTNVQASLADKHVFFIFEAKHHHSFLQFKGCATNSESGSMSPLSDGDQSPILPCQFQSSADPFWYHEDFGIPHI